jgi:hypothetical protein
VLIIGEPTFGPQIDFSREWQGGGEFSREYKGEDIFQEVERWRETFPSS